MLVWESFLGWPFLRKQTSGDTIINFLIFSIHLLVAQVVLLQGLLFWGGWAYLLSWFCLLLWLYLIFWYLFQLWFHFLHAEGEKKQIGFLVFTFFDWVAYDWIFLLKVPCRGLLTLMVIFCAWKDKTRVLVLRKENKNWVGREISWKKDVGSWGLLCQARAVYRSWAASQWRTWGA